MSVVQVVCSALRLCPCCNRPTGCSIGVLVLHLCPVLVNCAPAAGTPRQICRPWTALTALGRRRRSKCSASALRCAIRFSGLRRRLSALGQLCSAIHLQAHCLLLRSSRPSPWPGLRPCPSPHLMCVTHIRRDKQCGLSRPLMRGMGSVYHVLSLGLKDFTSPPCIVLQHTIEEKVIERAYKKLALDALVIQQGRLAEQKGKHMLLSSVLSHCGLCSIILPCHHPVNVPLEDHFLELFFSSSYLCLSC